MKIVNSTQPNNLFLLKHNKINPGNNTLSFCGKISFIAKPDDLIKNLETYSVNAQNRQMGIINYNCFVSLLQKGVMYVKSLFYKDKASQDINKMYETSYNVLDKYLNSEKDIGINDAKDSMLIENCAEIYAIALGTDDKTGFNVKTSQYAAKLSQAILTTLSMEKFDDKSKYMAIKEKYQEIKKHLDVAYNKIFPKTQVLEQGNVSINFRQNEQVSEALRKDDNIYYAFGDMTAGAYKSNTDCKEAYYFMKSYKFVSETIKLLENYFKLTDENKMRNLILRLQSVPNDAKTRLPVIPKERLKFDENDITYEKIKSSFLDKSSEEVGEKNSSIKEENGNFVFYSVNKNEPEANVSVNKEAVGALNEYFKSISKLCGQKTYTTLLHLSHRFLQRNPLYDLKTVYDKDKLDVLKNYVETIKNDIDMLLAQNASDLLHDKPISYFNENNGDKYILALNPDEAGKYQNKTYTIFIYKCDEDNKESLLNCNFVVDNNGNYGLLTFIENDNKLRSKYDNLLKEVKGLNTTISNLQKDVANKEVDINTKTKQEKNALKNKKNRIKNRIKNCEEKLKKKKKEKKACSDADKLAQWKRYQVKPNIIE